MPFLISLNSRFGQFCLLCICVKMLSPFLNDHVMLSNTKLLENTTLAVSMCNQQPKSILAAGSQGRIKSLQFFIYALLSKFNLSENSLLWGHQTSEVLRKKDSKHSVEFGSGKLKKNQMHVFRYLS